jgi:hypothetical protein
MLVCALLLCVTGCSGGGSSAKSIQSFQTGVEQYLAQRNNDPEALREVTLEDNRHGFAVLGGQDPRKSTDQRGLLLAHKPIGDRPWFVYLVGTVKKDVVQDLRVVALSATGGNPVWRVGPKNAAAFKQYRDAAMKDWRDHGGGSDPKSKPPVQYTTFPRASDAFEVSTSGTLIRAKHVESGAEFTVDISHVPPPAKKKSKK